MARRRKHAKALTGMKPRAARTKDRYDTAIARVDDAIEKMEVMLADYHQRKAAGLTGEEKEAAVKIEKLLDESKLTNEQKIKAVKKAANELGVVMSLRGINSIDIPLDKGPPTHHGWGRGDIPTTPKQTFDPSQRVVSFGPEIPSVTGGKSPAMDFVHALQQGNPHAQAAAERAAIDLTRKKESLADLLIGATYEWTKYFNFNAKQEKAVLPILAHYRQSLRAAHRFQLDNAFTQYATEVSNNTPPQKLLYRLQFCTLPYETTWIEFNLRVKVRTMRAYHGLEGVPHGVSDRMGLLLKRIDDTTATVEMVGEKVVDDVTCPCLHGYIFSLNDRVLTLNRKYNGLTPFSLHRRANMLKSSGDPYWKDLADPSMGEVIDKVGRAALWGYGDESGVIEAGDLRKLILPEFLKDHGEVAFSPMYDFFEDAGLNNLSIMRRMSRTIDSEIAEFAGMMRWIVTVLAMLNEVPTRTQYEQPMHQVKAGLTRRLPAFDYHRVTLKLPKTKPVPYIQRHLSNVERKHRAHMVREFWRTYLSENPCKREEHAWEYDYNEGYRLCGKCMSFSRLIHEHKRGDENLGWVHQEYVIKKGRE